MRGCFGVVVVFALIFASFSIRSQWYYRAEESGMREFDSIVKEFTFQQVSKTYPPGRPFASAPIDVNLDRLPPNFSGHDPVRIYEAAKQIYSPPLEKGQFESTSQFQHRLSERKRNGRETKVYGSLVLGDTFFIVCGNDLSFDYDADRQLFNFSSPTGMAQMLVFEPRSDRIVPGELRNKWIVPDVKLPGLKGFEPIEFEYDHTDLYWVRPAKSSNSVTSSSHLFMEPRKAKNLGKCSWVYIGKIADATEKKYKRDYYKTLNTFDCKIENTFYLQMDVEQIWLVESASGNILQKNTEFIWP